MLCILLPICGQSADVPICHYEVFTTCIGENNSFTIQGSLQVKYIEPTIVDFEQPGVTILLHCLPIKTMGRFEFNDSTLSVQNLTLPYRFLSGNINMQHYQRYARFIDASKGQEYEWHKLVMEAYLKQFGLINFYRQGVDVKEIEVADGIDHFFEVSDLVYQKTNVYEKYQLSLKNGGNSSIYYDTDCSVLGFSSMNVETTIFGEDYEVFCQIVRDRIENQDKYDSKTKVFLDYPYGYIIVNALSGRIENRSRNDIEKYSTLTFGELCKTADGFYKEHSAQSLVECATDYASQDYIKLELDQNLKSISDLIKIYDLAQSLTEDPSFEIEDNEVKEHVLNISQNMAKEEIKSKIVELNKLSNYFDLIENDPLLKFDSLLWCAAKKVLPENESESPQWKNFLATYIKDMALKNKQSEQ